MISGFSHLSVIGYRRLSILQLSLRPLNVMIGANGIGKSSVLDTIDLLAASADGNWQSTITERGGMRSLLTAFAKTNALTFGLITHEEGAGAAGIPDSVVERSGRIRDHT